MMEIHIHGKTGRELAKIVKGNNIYQYKYNDGGIRTEKNVNGTITKYYLEGSKVIYEETNGSVLYYSYDEKGSPIGINRDGEQFYYTYNGQGDIIGILNSSLNQVVSYTYDTWGKMISAKDQNGTELTNPLTLGLRNPFRFRGYYYDMETQLYYLQTRYYSPEIGRFLNADGLFESGHELLGNNLYAYCANNPVNYEDPDGEEILIGAIFAVCGIISAAATYTTQLEQDKQAGYKTNYVDAAARAIINGVTFYSAGFIASDIGNAIGSNKVTKASTSVSASTTSKGSTAKIVPSNLKEQLALEQVKSMPSNGKIMTNVVMNDPRWPASQGWVKMRQFVPTSTGNINIHYVYNRTIRIYDDFKIKY